MISVTLLGQIHLRSPAALLLKLGMTPSDSKSHHLRPAINAWNIKYMSHICVSTGISSSRFAFIQSTVCEMEFQTMNRYPRRLNFASADRNEMSFELLNWLTFSSHHSQMNLTNSKWISELISHCFFFYVEFNHRNKLAYKHSLDKGTIRRTIFNFLD